MWFFIEKIKEKNQLLQKTIFVLLEDHDKGLNMYAWDE